MEHKEHELAFSLSERDRHFLARSAEVRRRGIDVHANCRDGHVVGVREDGRRLVGYMARHQFEGFCFLHSALFRRDIADMLYENGFRLAVQETPALFLALADNRSACEIGVRYGAFPVGLDMLDEVVPEFVDAIRDFPPGGYYRSGDELRNVHDAPEERTVVFMLTRLSFQRAARTRRQAAMREMAQREMAQREMAQREVAERQLALVL